MYLSSSARRSAGRPGRDAPSAAAAPRARPPRPRWGDARARRRRKPAESSGSIPRRFFSSASVFFIREPRGCKAARRTLPWVSRGRDELLHEKRGLRRSARRFVMRDLEAGAIGPTRTRSISAGRCHLRLEGERAVYGGEGMPQQAWFLNVMRVMWNSPPSVASPCPSPDRPPSRARNRPRLR